jgi:hypothetical protein
MILGGLLIDVVIKTLALPVRHEKAMQFQRYLILRKTPKGKQQE